VGEVHTSPYLFILVERKNTLSVSAEKVKERSYTRLSGRIRPATVSLFGIPGCFADVLWLKQKADKGYFRVGKGQTYVWNLLLLLPAMGEYKSSIVLSDAFPCQKQGLVLSPNG
jgi:hypothetical protein